MAIEHFDFAPDFVFSPQPAYMIGTNNEDSTPNFCLITWIGFSADEGPCLMMTIGGSKLTKTNILREGRFSANMVTEDTLWLADYFGTTRGEERAKTAVNYTIERGHKVDVPVLGESHWIYECEVDRHVPLEGADLFIARILNIQIDQAYQKMDMEKIDLQQIRPVIYSPYVYNSIGEKTGEPGQWKEHLKPVEDVDVRFEKADEK